MGAAAAYVYLDLMIICCGIDKCISSCSGLITKAVRVVAIPSKPIRITATAQGRARVHSVLAGGSYVAVCSSADIL